MHNTGFSTLKVNANNASAPACRARDENIRRIDPLVMLYLATITDVYPSERETFGQVKLRSLAHSATGGLEEASSILSSAAARQATLLG